MAYVRYVKKATCREEREGTNRFPPLGKSWWDLPFPSLFDKREPFRLGGAEKSAKRRLADTRYII